MTRKELASLLGYKFINEISKAISKAKLELPSICEKDTKNKYMTASFSLEEILCICKYIHPQLNELQLELVKDNYISHQKTYTHLKSHYIDGTEKFLDRCKTPKKRKNIHSCALCVYCIGRTVEQSGNSKLYPYCKFYNRFISNMRIVKRNKQVAPNIFIDGCKTFLRADTPTLFYK